MDTKSKFIPSSQHSVPGPYLHSHESVTNLTWCDIIRAIEMVLLDKWKIIIRVTLYYMIRLVQ
jgi:hypothetical protein